MTDRTNRVRLEAITGQYEASMAAAGLSTKSLLHTINDVGVEGNKSFKQLGLGLLDVSAGTAAVAAAAAVGGLALVKFGKDGVSSYVSLVDQVRAYQQVTGASAEESSRMVAIGKAVGVENEAIAQGMFRLSRQIDSHADALKADGVVVAHTSAGHVDLTKTLLNVATAYQHAGAGAEANQIVFDAFGRSGLRMIPILRQSTDALQGFVAAAALHHQIVTDADLQAVFEYHVATRQLSESWSGLGRELGRDILPLLDRLAVGFKMEVEGLDKVGHAVMSVWHGATDLGTGLNHLLGGHAGAAKAAKDHAVAEQQAADATAADAQAVDDYVKSLDALYASSFSVEEAQGKFNKDLTDFADKVRAAQISGDKYATSLDSATSSGLANQDMVRGLVKDILATAKAAEQTGADVSAATATQRAALADVLTQLGFNRAEAQKYADVLASIDGKTISTTVDLDTSAAMAKINALVAAYAGIPGSIASPEVLDARLLAQRSGAAGPPSPQEMAARARFGLPTTGTLTGGEENALAGGGDAATAARAKVMTDAARADKAGAAAAKTADQQRAEDDARMKTEAEFGGISIADYQKYLDQRIAATTKFSAEWAGLMQERQRVNDEIGKGWTAAAEHIKEVEDNQYAAGRISSAKYRELLVDRANQAISTLGYWSSEAQKIIGQINDLDAASVKKWMDTLSREHEVGVLSNADYLSILKKRLAGLVQFSDEWMATWRDINQIEQAAADESARIAQQAAQARNDQVSAASKQQDDAIAKLNGLLDDEARLRAQQEQLLADHRKRIADIESGFSTDQARALGDRRQQLVDWAKLDDKVSVGFANSVSSLAGNVKDQIAQFDEWSKALADARARGVSDQVISMLGLDQGPQALGQLRMFSSATQSEIDDLNAAVAKRVGQAGDQVAVEASQSYSQVAALLKALAEKHAADIEAATEDFLTQQKNLDDQLKALGMDTGRSYVDAIAAGLASGLPGLVAAANAVRDAVQAASSVVHPTAPVQVPSLVDGLQLGLGSGIHIPELTPIPTGVNKGSLLGALAGMVGTLYPSHATGTSYVDRTGLANIHLGERILSAVDNERLVAAVQAGGSSHPVVNVAAPDVRVFVDGTEVTSSNLRVEVNGIVDSRFRGVTNRARQKGRRG